MLILLSAYQTPVLRGLIEPEVLKLGDHLTDLFQSWRRLSLGRDSPGVEQSLWVIDEADRYIKNLYSAGDSTSNVST